MSVRSGRGGLGLVADRHLDGRAGCGGAGNNHLAVGIVAADHDLAGLIDAWRNGRLARPGVDQLCRGNRRSASTGQPQKARPADQAHAQHGNGVFVVLRHRRSDFAVVEKDQIVRRAPLAPLLGRSILRVKRAVAALGQRHFIEEPVRTDEQARSGAVEIVVQHHDPAIGQRDFKALAVADVTCDIALPEI